VSFEHKSVIVIEKLTYGFLLHVSSDKPVKTVAIEDKDALLIYLRDQLYSDLENLLNHGNIKIEYESAMTGYRKDEIK